MSDSSEDEDLSRFKDVVDNSFVKSLSQTRVTGSKTIQGIEEKPVSQRYLEISSHYNDVKVPEEMQKRIGAKLSAVIQKNTRFVDVDPVQPKKRKIKGGVKLFKNSNGFLSCDDIKDISTEKHNCEAKLLKYSKVGPDSDDIEKLHAVTVSGEYVLSKEEIKCWKSRRKEKLYKYKVSQNSDVLVALE